MPRREPPEGYITSNQAIDLLMKAGAIESRAMFYKYVQQGQIEDYKPDTRKHGFYKISEVEALASKLTGFYLRKDRAETVIDWMTINDLPGVLELDLLVFKPELVGSLSFYMAWLQRNPRISQ